VDGEKILIADDEPNIRLLISSTLGKDYTVFSASDGQEAIDIARNKKPRPYSDGYYDAKHGRLYCLPHN